MTPTAILLLALGAASGAVTVLYFYARAIRRRTDQMAAFVDGLLNSNSQPAPLPESKDKIGRLEKSLNRAATELHKLLETLRLESSRRESLLASMVEGVLAVDRDLRVTFCNEAFARAVGAAWPITEGDRLLDLIRDPILLEMLTQVVQTNQSARRRIELGGTDSRSYEIHVAPAASGSGRAAIAILHDVTDLERLERVRKDFVANVSHELRTPLTAIRGYAETLLDGALEDHENNRKFVEVIKAHAIRLNNIASDLLTLSGLESGKPLESERTMVRSVIENALRTVEPEARLRNVRVECGEIGDFAISADRERLEQAVLNLLDNAAKFNRPGGQVRVEANESDDGKIQIVVSDNGVGIPSGDLPRIFERFYRVDKARSREVGGTGLGLSIVRHIVERMGGTIKVDSELGKGSTFTISLPSSSSQDA